MELFLGAVVALLSSFNLVCWSNLRRVPRLSPKRWTQPEAPYVSVLVPARNEAERIEPCIHSLCQQEYPAYEILVLDDESTDTTPEVLERLRRQYPERLRVLRGAPLPEGWVGKPWACYQLAQHARGEWLLFVDADTRFHPLALASTLQECQHRQWRFVSLLPREELRSLVEQLLIPLLYIFYFAYLPERWRRYFPRFHAASGQAFLIHSSLYWELGGHAAVRGEIVEDLALGRLIAQRLGSAPVADATEIISCRMYETSREAFLGFSKNTYPAMGYRWWTLAGFVGHLLVLSILPVLATLLGIAWNYAAWSLLGGTSYLLSVLLRWQVSHRFRLPYSQVWLQPLATIVASAIALNSYRWSITGRLQWRGRSYRPSVSVAE
ncbi:MAG: glycosyltransferase [Chlorobiota bacterium]